MKFEIILIFNHVIKFMKYFEHPVSSYFVIASKVHQTYNFNSIRGVRHIPVKKIHKLKNKYSRELDTIQRLMNYSCFRNRFYFFEGIFS